MNKNLKTFCLAFAVSVFALASCEANITPDDPDEGSSEETYVIDAEHNYIDGTTVHYNAVGGELKLKLEDVSDWSIKNAPSWVTFSAMSGKKSSSASVTLTASANSSEDPREASFIVCYTNKNVVYTAKQESGELIYVDASTVLASGSSITVPASSTYDYTVSSDASWAKPVVVKSGLKASSIQVALDANTGTDWRTATITLKGNLNSASFKVLQPGAEPTADTSKKFYKKVCVHEFTACWCQYCPLLLVAVEKSTAARPGRLVHYAFHPSGSENTGNFAFSDTYTFMNYYSCDGYPSSYLDGRAYQGASSDLSVNSTRLNAFIDEAVASYPAHCGIAVASGYAGSKVSADVYLATNLTGDYKVGVVLTEDGMIRSQVDAYDALATIGLDKSKLAHKNVVRLAATAVTGDAVSLTAGQVKKLSYTIDVPSGKIYNYDNVKVKVYIYRTAESGPAAVAGITYKNYSGLQVDNTTESTLGTLTSFQYE